MGSWFRVLVAVLAALGFVVCGIAQAAPCVVEPMHLAQLARHEALQLQTLQERHGRHTVSARTGRVFARLLQHHHGDASRRIAWRLSGYAAGGINAHAAHDGSVLVSRGLDDPALPEPQLAAGLAHEIAHVLLRHSHERACAALSGGTAASGDDASSKVPHLMHAQELQADALAVDLLRAAGYPGRALSQLLMRLAPRVPPHTGSGSHPEHALRLARAIEAASAAR